MKYNYYHYHKHLSLLIIFIYTYQTIGEICGPMNIVGNIDHMKQFKNCTIILGNVKMTLIDRVTQSQWEQLSLPNLREITDNLVLYRVYGLESLGTIFPNLTVIRGFKLAFDYALILYENKNLTEVGLKSLTTILRGYVRIEKNDAICYSQSINWDEITKVSGNVIERDHYYCPSSKRLCDHCPDKRCWNRKDCYKSDVNNNCHELCLGGCSLPNSTKHCRACKKYNYYGTCTRECPVNTFKYDNYYCLSKEHCLSKRRFLFETSCVEDCPPNYKRVNNSNYCEICADGPCSSSCNDNHTLTDMSTIEKVKGCRIINGTLEIRHIQSEQTLKELYEALNALEQICGGLIVQRNYFSSLNFLPKLRAIHGERINSNYSVSVMENPNLASLLNWTVIQNLTIKGKLFFHYNPKLCLGEIDKFRQKANLKYNFTELEISRNSNGDKVECGFDSINSTYKVLSSTSVEIQWDPYHPPKTHAIFGYQVFYAPSELVNTNRYRVAEVCQDTIWKEETLFLHDVINDNDYYDTLFNITIENLNPYSNYSYYVASVLIENSTSSDIIQDVGAQSKVVNFTTLPDQPGRPRHVRAFNISYSEIKLKWRAPSQPNGKLTKYVITAYLQQYEHKNINQRNYCLAPKIPEYEQTQGFYTGNNDACESNDDITFVFCGNHKCNDNPKDEDQRRVTSGCEDFEFTMDYLIDDSPTTKTNKHDPFSGLNLKKRDVTTYENIKEQMKTLPTGEYEIFNSTIDASHDKIIINNLLHYSMYKIYISACNEEYCSTVTIVTQRTSAKPQADDIKELIAHKDQDTIVLFWREPLHPNSIILYYNIELRSLDDQQYSSSKISICITREQHLKNNFFYKVNHLPPSSAYVVRIRATSLYGNGNWTDKIILTSWNWKFISNYTLVLTIILIVIFILICVVIYKWKHDKKLFIISRKQVRIHKKLYDLGYDHGFISTGYFRGSPCLLKVSNKDSFFDDINVFMKFNSEYILKILGTITNHLPYIVIFENCQDVLSEYLKKCSSHNVSIPHKYMFQWATEIADGMAYLASKNYVHGDLSARNILLTNNFTIKISKFGFGKGLEPQEYVKLFDDETSTIPLRWTCKEILSKRHKKISTLSDIWSYGVCLWEIGNCNNVNKPYSKIIDSNLVAYLENGGSLEIPHTMPIILVKIIKKCFKSETLRPSFKDIVLLGLPIYNNFYVKSFVFSKNSSIQIDYVSASASFNRQCDEFSDDLSLINNEIENIDSVSSFSAISDHEVIINSNRNRLNNFFQISNDDWEEWSKAKIDPITLTWF
ncbi:insulin-like growth factor 1 receptor [Chrysoperla carnea]|uniref:insulin-like growth factor 1 receptor n=1 Tax=Chrysoperla carnea TaxID=189513 RepID=UPI001D08FEC7|nr:insulin-like growth factor 1 receptor [Chrysoperla carnea]